MKSKKRKLSMRGKVAMTIIGLVGLVYWTIGKIEVLIGTLQEQRSHKRDI